MKRGSVLGVISLSMMQSGEKNEWKKMAPAWAIKSKRQKSRLSARKLSEAAGLSASYVSKVEAGEIEPSMRAFASIANVLEMNKEEVFAVVKILGSMNDN